MHSSIFFFDSRAIQINEIGRIKNHADEFEYPILDFAREWLSPSIKKFEIQTSGSTGTPKKITLAREQIKESIKLTKDFFNLKPGQVALLCLDTNFIAGRMMIFRAIEIGLDLVCAPPVANPLEHIDCASPISFAALVPYQLESILKSPSSIARLNKIEKVILGGAKVSPSLIERIQPLPTQFYETYGMTETITHVAIRKLNPPENNFTALPGVSFSTDNRNCLVIRATHLGSNSIITNDVVELSGSKSFKLIGRADNIINTGGVKVSPEALEDKIESILSPFLDGKDFFIAGVNDPAFGQKVVLFMESAPLQEPDKNKILSQLKLHLEKWEVPKDIICVPLFKKTESGKVNRLETIKSIPALSS